MTRKEKMILITPLMDIVKAKRTMKMKLRGT